MRCPNCLSDGPDALDKCPKCGVSFHGRAGVNQEEVLNYFYYLAPLWFVVKTFFWPYFRSGVVFGSGVWGTAAFYLVEGGLGAALWFKLPYANVSALAENVIYLAFALNFMLFTPWDIALSLANDNPNAEALSRHYAAALPGIMYSALHVMFRIKKAIGRA